MNNEELDRLLARWAEYKKAHDESLMKMTKYKEKITQCLHDGKMDGYDNGEYQLKKVIQKRESICKKSIPKHIWDEYAVTKPVEFVLIQKKNARDK